MDKGNPKDGLDIDLSQVDTESEQFKGLVGVFAKQMGIDNKVLEGGISGFVDEIKKMKPDERNVVFIESLKQLKEFHKEVKEKNEFSDKISGNGT